MLTSDDFYKEAGRLLALADEMDELQKEAGLTAALGRIGSAAEVGGLKGLAAGANEFKSTAKRLFKAKAPEAVQNAASATKAWGKRNPYTAAAAVGGTGLVAGAVMSPKSQR